LRKSRKPGELSPMSKYLSTIKISSTSKRSKYTLNNLYRGDPMQLLKSVNPSEAGILDAASKCHIRFRLGGDVILLFFYDIRNFRL
jgi:hypothetical protein